MSTLIQEYSTLTAKGQTTVPKAVRQALGVDAGDRIAFRVDENGVSVHRVDIDDGDPAIDSFLTFLARDIGAHPEGVKALSPALADRLLSLTVNVPVDIDADITGDVDI